MARLQLPLSPADLQALRGRLIEHRQNIAEHGDDMPAISGWKWGGKGAAPVLTSTAADHV